MSDTFNPTEFEKKWRERWADEQIYKTPSISEKDAKAYILDMYPYPSGSGLHVGHPRGYLGTDVFARFERMQGKKVLHPMGFDSFGLPAENYAIKTGTPPRESTDNAIAMFKDQIANLGMSYDWDLELMSHDPEYMKWTQWLFLQFYKAGLAYQKEAPVNWCPHDNTVLANEQVEPDGTCERCGTEVIQKNMKQWFFKITDYSDELIEGLQDIDWPESTKLGQINWIGKSEGAEIEFKLTTHLTPPSAPLSRYTWRGAGGEVMKLAKEHRQNQTPAEEKLWKALKASKTGYKIRRQHAIKSYIADFYCAEANLIIELDGAFHENLKDEDEIRTSVLRREGYQVIRFNNDEVIYNLDTVVEKIISEIEKRIQDNTVAHDSNSAQSLTVFTTRPDTIFGATFMVIAPEHMMIDDYADAIENIEEIRKYQEAAKSKTELERQQQKEKTGVEIKGVQAINPVSGESIPIFVADYVLGGYGTGAIMAVPAHDERDFEFAEKYGIAIKSVVAPEFGEPHPDAKTKESVSAIIFDTRFGKYGYIQWENDGDATMPAGGIEEGEDRITALKREILEETGFSEITIAAELQPVVAHYFAHNKNLWRTNTIYNYLVTVDSSDGGKTSKEDNEHFDFTWGNPDEILRLVERNPSETNEDIILRYVDGIRKAIELGIDTQNSLESVDYKITTDGIIVNSDFLNGLSVSEGKEKIIRYLEDNNIGSRKTTYRLRDWLVSRQRYWGCPIPMLYRELSNEEEKLQELFKKDPEFVLHFHAWGSDPSRNYHPSTDKALEDMGIQSLTPTLPNAKMPKREEWHKAGMYELEKYSGNNLVLTGRSLGCTSALKVAEERTARKLILVAPTSPVNQQKDRKALQDGDLDISTEEHTCLAEFVGLEDGVIDFDKVNRNVGETVIFLSKDDPYIPLKETRDYFEDRLDNVRFQYFNNAGHFNAEHGYSQFPELVEEILRPVDLTIQPVPEKDLPVLLPENVDFKPTGESPLRYSEDFHASAEEKYGKGWRREVDTLDTFMDSSWYFFRFTDVENTDAFADQDKVNSWMPVDLYVGGAEHTVLHLMYARFFTKVLRDLGYLNFDEPFQKLRHQGMILAEDGRKMSKRWGNTINPNDEVEKYGADTMRVYEMFMGPFDATMPWDTKAEVGVHRFINKVWNQQEKVEVTQPNQSSSEESDTLEKELHRVIKKVTEDIESMSFNTAIAKLMEFANLLHKEETIMQSVWERFLLLLAPFAPFVTEELWSLLGNDFSIHQQQWPTYDESMLVDDTVEMAVQVNGKVRATIQVAPDASEEEVVAKAFTIDTVAKYFDAAPKKVIYIPGRILNLVP